jgi:hypothetical protein
LVVQPKPVKNHFCLPSLAGRTVAGDGSACDVFLKHVLVFSGRECLVPELSSNVDSAERTTSSQAADTRLEPKWFSRLHHLWKTFWGWREPAMLGSVAAPAVSTCTGKK